MARKKWIRLYTDVLDDPKVATLEDRQIVSLLRVWILAANYESTGRVPRVALCRTIPESDITALLRAGLLEPDPEGDGYQIHNYARRQSCAETDKRRRELGRERVRRHRERRRAEAPKQTPESAEREPAPAPEPPPNNPQSTEDVTLCNALQGALQGALHGTMKRVTQRYTFSDFYDPAKCNALHFSPLPQVVTENPKKCNALQGALHDPCNAVRSKKLKDKRLRDSPERVTRYGNVTQDHADPEPTPEPTPKRKRHTYTAEFETFWNAYPRHDDKLAAFKAWKTARHNFSAEELTAAAERYRDDPNRRGLRFTKHGATWLHDTDPTDAPPLPPTDPAGYDGIAEYFNNTEREADAPYAY